MTTDDVKKHRKKKNFRHKALIIIIDLLLFISAEKIAFGARF